MRAALQKNLPILPLVVDIRYPSPGQGTSNQMIAPALQRLPCDLVLALGLVHVLVFEHFHPFEQVCEMLAPFSKRWLLVEFIPPEDEEVCKGMVVRYSWYTRDNFIKALKKWFPRVILMPSFSGPRELFLCEK